MSQNRINPLKNDLYPFTLIHLNSDVGTDILKQSKFLLIQLWSRFYFF